jgi:hypothetical protein
MPAPSAPRAAAAPLALDYEPYPNPRAGKGGLVAAVVAVVLLAGGAVAYFGGLIPH